MRNLLKDIFLQSFRMFLENEKENILMGTSERNLCARLACVLERVAHDNGLTEYFADVEYNRKQNRKVKTIIDADFRVINITVDLILHSRGNMHESDNLIAFEMKRLEHPEEEKQKDRDRLIAMTKPPGEEMYSADGQPHPEHVCGYQIGYLGVLDADNSKFILEEYFQGIQKGTLEMEF